MSQVDPILLSVYARAFKSITDEMSISVQKTTRSPILCEAKDFVTGLYDARGNMLEQTENLPILAFSLAPVCKYIVEFFGEGARSISATGKGTICNMGAEIGATTSIFPYDEHMAAYLKATNRSVIAELASIHAEALQADEEVSDDPNTYYDQVIEIDLSSLEIGRAHV